jgi:hypothetical protein
MTNENPIKYHTNQELLKELEKRLPEFTEDEFGNLFKSIMINMSPNYREELLGSIKETNPQQVHDSIQKAIQQAEQEKKDKTIEKLRKLLKK